MTLAPIRHVTTLRDVDAVFQETLHMPDRGALHVVLASVVANRMAGMPVQLQVVVDADLVGGASVLVGDTVIDGTVRRRLDQLRDNLINPEQRTTTHG